MEEADEAIAGADGDGGIAQSGGTGDGTMGFAVGFGEVLLGLEAGGAGAAFAGHNGAEAVFLGFAVEGELPGFGRAEGDGEPGGFTEGLLVVLVDFRIGQRLNQALVGIHNQFSGSNGTEPNLF